MKNVKKYYCNCFFVSLDLWLALFYEFFGPELNFSLSRMEIGPHTKKLSLPITGEKCILTIQ